MAYGQTDRAKRWRGYATVLRRAASERWGYEQDLLQLAADWDRMAASVEAGAWSAPGEER